MNVGMVFAIVFAIIVMGLILAFGTDQIRSIFCLSSDAQTGKAIQDLKTNVETVYTQAMGSTYTFTLKLPGDAKFCFINASDPKRNIAGDWNPDPVYQTMIREEGYSLWYYTYCWGNNVYGDKIPHLFPDENFCATSGAKLYLHNKGLYVEIGKS